MNTETMYAKLWVLGISGSLISLGLLGLRHQRLELMHSIAELNTQSTGLEHSMWDLEVRVTQEMSPKRLHEAIEREGLQLSSPPASSPRGPHRFVSIQ